MYKWLGKRRKGPPSPAWMKWLLIAFVLYAIASNANRDEPGVFKHIVNDVESSLNLSEYKDKLLPGGNVPLRFKELAAGKGNPAICGQEVTIAYEAFLGNGDTPAATVKEDNPLTFRIGEGKAMPALEQGVIGMRVGGRRGAIAPPGMATGMDTGKSDLVRFDIALLALSPALPDFWSTPYRIAEVTPGTRATILCGHAVKARVTVWSLDGKKIFSGNEPLAFTPGKSETFLGLEQGVIGMRVGGMRTLVVPPVFQKTMDGNAPIVDIAFPKSQTVLVDVETLP